MVLGSDRFKQEVERLAGRRVVASEKRAQAQASGRRVVFTLTPKILHPAIAAQRSRHSAVWLGGESLRRHDTRLSLSPPEAFALLRDVLAQAA